MSGELSGNISFEAIIFDVDGTLADSVQLFLEMSTKLLEQAGVPPVPEQRIKALMSEGARDLLLQLFPKNYPKAREISKRLVAENMQSWLARYHQETKPLPSAISVVRRLRDEGFKLGIATSSGHSLPFLDRWSLRDCFIAVVGREDVKKHKPHPEPLLLCAELMSVEPARCVYVGDSVIDIRAAHAAGMLSVAVTSGTGCRESLGREQPNVVLHRLADLPEWLGLSQRK